MPLIFLITLLSPTLFQIIMGNKAKSKSIEYSYGKICLLSYIFQVVGLFISSYLITHDDIRACGAAMAGLLFFNILMIMVITVVIITQYFRYKY